MKARLGLGCLTVLAYAVALTSPFQFDDRGVAARDFSPPFGLRPLLELGYALCGAVGGGATWPFHAFNLLLHLVGVELVVRVYNAATYPERRFPFAGLSPGAIVAGALFALHPLQTEAVTYVTGRSSSQSAVLLLLGLLFYAAGARENRPVFSWLLAPLCFLAALGTKETSAGFPLLLLLWELTIERSRPGVLLWRVGPWLALGATLLLVVVTHPRYFTLLYASFSQRGLVESVRYQLGALAYLLERLSLLRAPCIDPGLWLALPSARVVAGTVALLGAALGWAALRGKPLVRFGLALFVLQTVVLHTVIPRADVLNERHAYLANAGLFLAAGALWGARPLRAWAWAFAALLALLTLRRNLEYQTQVALWESTARSAPHNPRAHNNLGVAHELAGDLPRARLAYAEALKRAPGYVSARQNLQRVIPQERRQKVGRQ